MLMIFKSYLILLLEQAELQLYLFSLLYFPLEWNYFHEVLYTDYLEFTHDFINSIFIIYLYVIINNIYNKLWK